MEKTEKKEREIAIPGEVLAEGDDYLPGEGTRREGKKIIAGRFGLKDEQGRLVKIIPLSGIYVPRRGNLVLGTVVDITFNGWLMDISAPYSSFLPLMECPRFFNKDDLSEYFNIGDILALKVDSVKRKGVDLTIKMRGLGKLEEGMIIKVNPNKVPRVIGKGGSMISLIKSASDCEITVGQNGLIWIKGKKVDDELFAKEAIIYVTERSFVEGLTEKTKDWLEGKLKEKGIDKKLEIKVEVESEEGFEERREFRDNQEDREEGGFRREGGFRDRGFREGGFRREGGFSDRGFRRDGGFRRER